MADGLLTSIQNALQNQYQTTKRGLGLLVNDPAQFGREAVARYFPTPEEVAQQRALEKSGGIAMNTPYMDKMFNLAQFQGSIKPTGLLQAGKPFQSGIVDEKIGNSTVSYQLGDDGILKIFSLRTPQSKRGQGSATEAMNQIVQRADESGIPIKLDASPLDKKTSLNKLVKFYQKFGFETTGEKVNMLGDPVMIRTPKTLK